MRVANFTLLIPEGQERESGHVFLNNGQQFTLKMVNHWFDRACDAEITVDGKSLGGFRINSGATITLERPPNETGRFTFYRSVSEEAAMSGVAMVENKERGLVSVRFKPEVRRPKSVLRSAGGGQSMRGMDQEEKTSGGIITPQAMMSFHDGGTTETSVNLESGITGLSGHSNQQFETVTPLIYDAAEEVVINIRLVCDKTVRPLQAVQTVPRSNDIPAPVQ